MATMMPNYPGEKTPPGEKLVFHMLAKGPDEWTVMHSLDVAPWNDGLRTEIDFVVIMPETGILCIEVKSQSNIEYNGERWSPSTIKRNPFSQAIDGRFTLYRGLRELLPEHIRFPVAHCVVFPSSPFELRPNLSVKDYELIDSRAFRGFANSSEFCKSIKTRFDKSVSEDHNLRPISKRLTPDQVQTIVKCCLPIQKRRSSLREEIAQREKNMEELLLDRQKVVIELAHDNNRLAVFGGAGTGKTLIAMELARRLAESFAETSQRVGLLCFNQLVGDWMEDELKKDGSLPPNLIVGRALRVLAKMAGINVPPSPPEEFWDTILPSQLEEKLTDPGFKADACFDYLVLDEAQDILARPHVWNILLQFMVGGIGCSNFVLLGDTENQVLANTSQLAESLQSLRDSGYFTRFRLRENCRNYKIVGDTAVKLSGLSSQNIYDGFRRDGGSDQNFDIFIYDSDESQEKQLRDLLSSLKKKGWKPSEIAILSFCAENSSLAKRVAQHDPSLQPAWKKGSAISYTTIHAFKGMENKIIILTDVVLDGKTFQRNIFYTGMTRALETVYILCHVHSKCSLQHWLIGE
jgi:hypothetical protein